MKFDDPLLPSCMMPIVGSSLLRNHLDSNFAKIHLRKRTPAPPPFSSRNSTPANSRAARIVSIVRCFSSSPLSRRATVSGETLASFANSRPPTRGLRAPFCTEQRSFRIPATILIDRRLGSTISYHCYDFCQQSGPQCRTDRSGKRYCLAQIHPAARWSQEDYFARRLSFNRTSKSPASNTITKRKQ